MLQRVIKKRNQKIQRSTRLDNKRPEPLQLVIVPPQGTRAELCARWERGERAPYFITLPDLPKKDHSLSMGLSGPLTPR